MCPMTTAINLRNVPPGFARRLKIAAAVRGVSVKQFILDVVEEKLQKMERAGMLPVQPQTKRPARRGKADERA